MSPPGRALHADRAGRRLAGGIRPARLVDGSWSEGGTGAQLAQAIANLAGLLEGEGASLTDVVKTTVFLTDMADYAAMNDAYVAAFGDHRPARSAVAVAGLPLGALVEIEAWAWTGGDRSGMMEP